MRFLSSTYIFVKFSKLSSSCRFGVFVHIQVLESQISGGKTKSAHILFLALKFQEWLGGGLFFFFFKQGKKRFFWSAVHYFTSLGDPYMCFAESWKASFGWPETETDKHSWYRVTSQLPLTPNESLEFCCWSTCDENRHRRPRMSQASLFSIFWKWIITKCHGMLSLGGCHFCQLLSASTTIDVFLFNFKVVVWNKLFHCHRITFCHGWPSL